MIKLIISDVDGTLVPDGTPNLNPEYYDVISGLIDKGIKVCIASGRQYESVRSLFEPIQDKLYFIAEGGGVVRTTDQVLNLDILPDCYPGLVEDVRKTSFDMMLSTPDEALMDAGEDSELYRLMKEGYHYNIVNMENLDQAPWDRSVKLALYHTHDAEGECKRARLEEKWGSHFQIMNSGVHWVDCVSMTSNKGNAVVYLQKHLGVTKEETLVFGDNMNDMSMFREAGISCTVQNARDEVKAVVDRVTDSFMEDGVLKVLKEYL